MPIRRLSLLLIVAAVALAACGGGGRPVLVDVDGAESAGASAERPTLTVEVDGGPREPEAVPTTTTTTQPEPASTVPLVVYDTDMGPDIDDVLALAMLHGYQKRGMIELAAVTVSRESVLGARYVDAVNTFYGRPDVPIGVYRGQVKPYDERGSYVQLADRWPNDVADRPIPDGYKLHRQVLVDGAATGRPVVFIQTGYSGNLAALTGSGPDEISDRPGGDLVRDHATLLSIMAGANRGFVEFNVEYDVPSARTLIRNWPAPMVQSPFELGDGIHYPYGAIRDNLGWVERHPVKEAYEFRDLTWHQDAPPFYNMKSWDLTSVLYAVEPDAGYFLISGSGTVTIDDSGRTGFSEDGGLHRRLGDAGSHSEDQRRAIVDRMIELVSDQP